jgi:transposase
MKKRDSAEQIVAKLRQAGIELGKGLKVPEVCKHLGVSEQAYYRWRQKYGAITRCLLTSENIRWSSVSSVGGEGKKTTRR